jgi:hypothetical protein
VHGKEASRTRKPRNEIPKGVDISARIGYNRGDLKEHGGLRVYRLLIVTRDQQVEEMFGSMQGWEAMGFNPPRLRRTVAEAVECMRKHHIDAIAVDDDPELTALNPWLDENAPYLPIFEIVREEAKQLEIIREVELLLNRLHTDDSNDDYNEMYYFQQAQKRWKHRLLSGLAPTKAFILAHERMYRCADDPYKPCVYARINVPEGETFITGRWHYGSERLGIALQNFFSEEFDHHSIHLAVVSPEEIRVVICPRKGDGEREVEIIRARKYIEGTIEQIHNYLGLSMSIAEIRVRDGLVDFAADCGKS